MATVVPMDWNALRREFNGLRATMIPDDMRAAVAIMRAGTVSPRR